MIDGDFLICFRIKHRNIIYRQRQGLYNLSFLDNLQHVMLLLIYANLVVYTYKKGDSDIQVVGYSPSSPPFENILILVNFYSLPLPRRYMFMFPFLYQPGCIFTYTHIFVFFLCFVFSFCCFFLVASFSMPRISLKLGVNHVKYF